MALTLYMHPLSSYCHKALIALYENATPFTAQFVDFSNAEQDAAFRQLWPVRKFPLLRDGDTLIPESTSIIEYLALHYPGASKLVPDDKTAAAAVRAQDRFFDLHLHNTAQTIIGDRLRPAGKNDALGVEQARRALDTALAIAESRMTGRTWAVGESFTMADCAAAPALFYIDMVITPLRGRFDNLAAYLARLTQRPSYVRALKEAEPYFHYVPR